jgi:hypothetical protein
MTARRRLENRRFAETFTIEVAGLKYTATIGRFSDGTIGEIFLSNTKPSSQSDVNARDAAVAASLAFQFGCPLETLRHALLRDPRGNASSPLGCALDQIFQASSHRRDKGEAAAPCRHNDQPEKETEQ